MTLKTFIRFYSVTSKKYGVERDKSASTICCLIQRALGFVKHARTMAQPLKGFYSSLQVFFCGMETFIITKQKQPRVFTLGGVLFYRAKTT